MIAERVGRSDMQSTVLRELTDMHNARLEPELAHRALARAVELARDSGSPTTRAWTFRLVGRQAMLEGRLDEAGESLEQSRALFAESGVTLQLARTLNSVGRLAWDRADLKRAEEPLREAIRLLKPLEDRGTLVESQRMLAQVLLEQGRLDEAERLALEALETVGAGDRRRPQRRGSRSGSCEQPRPATTRQSSCCANRSRSCARPTSGSTRSSRSRLSPGFCVSAGVKTTRDRSARSSPG